jgi:hypothetical protein
MTDYNTQREKLIIPEYGRHIHIMVNHCISIEDRDERNRCAKAIIDVMGQLNPHLRDVADFTHKLWDHLFIISNFKLDVDSPYPKPNPEKINEKPEPMQYPQSRIRFKHYGKTVEGLIKKASALEDGEERNAFVEAIANLMKKFYLTWNRDSVNDSVILEELKLLSENKLKTKETFQLDSTNEIIYRNNLHAPVQQNNNRKKKNGQKKNKMRKRY